MVYETFQKLILSELKKRLGGHFRILLQKVPKNNGTLLDGLCISPEDASIAPAVYLNSYYQRFQEGVPLEMLVEEILAIYQESSDALRTDFSLLQDFSQLKEKVAYKLIHTAANKTLLESVPSVPYLDLSIVFYLFLERNELGQMTALIHNSHLSMWGTSVEELYRLAAHNTPILFPPDLKTMAQVMGNILNDPQNDTQEGLDILLDHLLQAHEISPLYVLTNHSGINGACSILYPDLLKNFAKLLGADLVILPSSIHEVLLLPYSKEVSFDELSALVSHINQAEVPVEDRLSNHVYFYSRQTDQVVSLPDSVSSYIS